MPPTLPLIFEQLPDCETLNHELRQQILAMVRENPDMGTNQPGGKSYFLNKWLSPTDIHKRPIACFQTLVQFTEAAANHHVRLPDPEIRLSIQSMWCMMGVQGLEGARHDHAGKVSAAYCVDAGTSGAGDGGQFLVYSARKETVPSLRITPEAGKLILFSSRLEHAVSSYSGTAPRIMISFNLF